MRGRTGNHEREGKDTHMVTQQEGDVKMEKERKRRAGWSDTALLSLLYPGLEAIAEEEGCRLCLVPTVEGTLICAVDLDKALPSISILNVCRQDNYSKAENMVRKLCREVKGDTK